MLNYWGVLKPGLRDPNLALSFCYVIRTMNNRNRNVKNKTFSLRESRVSGGHSGSLDKTKYNTKCNADSLRVATKSCIKQTL